MKGRGFVNTNFAPLLRYSQIPQTAEFEGGVSEGSNSKNNYCVYWGGSAQVRSALLSPLLSIRETRGVGLPAMYVIYSNTTYVVYTIL